MLFYPISAISQTDSFSHFEDCTKKEWITETTPKRYAARPHFSESDPPSSQHVHLAFFQISLLRLGVKAFALESIRGLMKSFLNVREIESKVISEHLLQQSGI